MKFWGAIAASATLYLLAYPPVNAGFLVFVALVPWLVALRTAARKQIGWGGFLWGFMVVGWEMIWIPKLVFQWTNSPALGWIPWLVCAIIGGGYYAFMAHLMRKAQDRNWLWAIPLLWAGFEIVRSYMPAVAFPFFLIATPLWPYPYLIQAAHFGTIYLVSAWVVAINVLFYAFLSAAPFRPLRPVVISVLILTALSIVQYQTPIEGKITYVAAGQPGVDMAFGKKDSAQKLFGAMEKVNYEARQMKARMLILPEGLGESEGSGVPRTDFRIEPTIPTLLGAQRFQMNGTIGANGTSGGDGKRYQSAIACYEGSCKYADKARLVVFGEYVPGRGYIPFLDQFQLSDRDLTPADKTSSVNVGGIEVGPLICFEGLFWDVAHKQSENGAQVLAVMSLDDWYMGTPAPDQLRAASVWRAVETGLPVVRAATTGYTMGVDQRGKVIDELPLGVTQALMLRIAIEDKPKKQPQRAIFVWGLGLSLPILTIILWWKRKNG